MIVERPVRGRVFASRYAHNTDVEIDTDDFNRLGLAIGDAVIVHLTQGRHGYTVLSGEVVSFRRVRVHGGDIGPGAEAWIRRA